MAPTTVRDTGSSSATRTCNGIIAQMVSATALVSYARHAHIAMAVSRLVFFAAAHGRGSGPDHRVCRRPRHRRHRPRHRQRHRRHQRREDHRGRSGVDAGAGRRDARRPQGQDDPARPGQRARPRRGDDGPADAIQASYTRDNLLRQLRTYAMYGVTTVFSLGDDQAAGFELRNENATAADRARLFVAGRGDRRQHRRRGARQRPPRSPTMKPDLLKIRVDDNLGTSRKMPEAAWRAVIDGSRTRASCRSRCTSTGSPTRRRRCWPAPT